jgi:hypothetical protein
VATRSEPAAPVVRDEHGTVGAHRRAPCAASRARAPGRPRARPPRVAAVASFTRRPPPRTAITIERVQGGLARARSRRFVAGPIRRAPPASGTSLDTDCDLHRRRTLFTCVCPEALLP